MHVSHLITSPEQSRTTAAADPSEQLINKYYALVNVADILPQTGTVNNNNSCNLA